MTVASKPLDSTPSVLSGVLVRFGQIAVGFLLEALILFLGVGRLDWTWAWVYLAIYVVIVTINATFLMRTNLEMVAERGRGFSRMPGWDKLVSGLWSVAQFVALPLIAALDVRFGWTRDFNAVNQLLGALVFAGGLGLFSWAMIVNAYFSTAARIQSGQTVCRSGPYRFVRHPGYAGAILQSLGIALLLGSWWALIPAAAAVAFMVIRTALEDRMLQAELDGYAEYVHEVRFRLVPRCW
jgi:protein-S-isoprenylcysteine O-methyltransferase Ste14